MHTKFGSWTDHNHTYKLQMAYCVQINAYTVQMKSFDVILTHNRYLSIKFSKRKYNNNMYLQLQTVTILIPLTFKPMTICSESNKLLPHELII